MEKKDFLPIGSVVRILKGEEAMFMIAGYLPQNKEGERLDYIAVRYPMGAFNSNVYFFFNHEHIKEVVFKGYECKEYDAFLKIMNGLIAQEEMAK